MYHIIPITVGNFSLYVEYLYQRNYTDKFTRVKIALKFQLSGKLLAHVKYLKKWPKSQNGFKTFKPLNHLKINIPKNRFH